MTYQSSKWQPHDTSKIIDSKPLNLRMDYSMFGTNLDLCSYMRYQSRNWQSHLASKIFKASQENPNVTYNKSLDI